MTEKIEPFWSEYLKIQAKEHCYGKFLYNCETNDRHVLVTNVSMKKNRQKPKLGYTIPLTGTHAVRVLDITAINSPLFFNKFIKILV